MGVGLQITTQGGELVAPTELGAAVWELEESRRYRIDAFGEAIDAARLDVRDLPRIDARTFELPVGSWTAKHVDLCVWVGDRVVNGSVRVVPRSEKLDDATWLRLVEDLEAWVPGLTAGATGGTSGRVGIDGIDSPGFAAAALLPLVPGVLSALRQIAARPREETIEISDEVRLHAVRRADAGVLSFVTRHGSAAAALDGWRSAGARGPEPFVPQWRTEESLDHPVNRYVAWAVERARARLESLAGRLSAAAEKTEDGDTAAWCRARAGAAHASALQLAAIRARSFLREIRPAPATESSLLAIRDDPAYSRFHKLVRPFLSPRFALDEDDKAPARPTFELYELWTFLAVTRALEAAFPECVARRHVRRSEDGLGAVDLVGSTVELVGGGGMLRVSFNMTFRSYFNARRDGPHSISGERRPDIVVEWRGDDGRGAWMFLDAKYRVAQRHLYEAFESVHIYQHSLRWPSNGGVAKAGFLLVPAMLDATAEWFGGEFHATHRCGCFEFRPDGDVVPIVAAIATLRGS